MRSLQGHLLLASPVMMDPNFAQSVVLICEHNDQGAMGLVLNRPMEMTIDEQWPQVSVTPCACEQVIFVGGPCEGPLMILHDSDDFPDLSPLAHVHLSTEKSEVEQLVASPPPRIKFLVGYAGWGPDQLENEIEQSGWATMPADSSHIFDTGDGEQLWMRLIELQARAVNNRGLRNHITPSDPSVN